MGQKSDFDYIITISKTIDSVEMKKLATDLKSVGAYVREYGYTGYRLNSKLSKTQLEDYIQEKRGWSKKDFTVIGTLEYNALRI